ncbi:MAG: hypothetical protein ACRCX2_29640 [Paraclostridium sp.]
MNIELKKYGENIDFTSLVGNESSSQGKKTLIYSWCANKRELSIMIKDENDTLVGAETISLAFGIIVFIEKLNMYGFNVTISDGIIYSPSTIHKAAGLLQAGFHKLIKNNDNYTIDNIFEQNILDEKELNMLINSDVTEINLIDIK